MTLPLTLETAACTQIGRCRDVNQDAVALRSDLGIYILADGMGGHAAGEVASTVIADATSPAAWPPMPSARI